MIHDGKKIKEKGKALINVHDVSKSKIHSMDDIRFMSMVYKLLNSLIISLETYQFDDIQPKDLENWKKE